MKIQTAISNPFWYVILLIAVIAAVLYVVYTFRNAKTEYPRNQRVLLSIIRFLYSFLIGFLLLSPLAEIIEKRVEKPILVVGIDDSESIRTGINQPGSVTDSLLSLLNQQFNDVYRIETFAFGDAVRKTDSFSYAGLKSNYASFLNEIDRRYYKQNVGAVLVAGDGIFNEGLNPEQIAGNFDYPIYTLGLGDTSINPDQLILDVAHNPNVFIKNSFPLELELNFIEYPFNSTQLSITVDGKLMMSENIDVVQANYYFAKEYQINAEEVGIKTVVVSLSPFAGEFNTQNNRYTFPIEVHDNRKNILFLSEGPHPDIGAISETLQNQANYKIDVKQLFAFNEDLEEYDLVVLNQLPSFQSQNNAVFETIKSSSVPLLIIVGPNTAISTLNNMDLGFQQKQSLLSEESLPYFSETFSLFTIPDNIKEIEKIYPPLLTYFTEYSVSDNYSVLAYQKIKGIERDSPLLMLGENKGRKVGVIMGEGVWRWKIREYQYFNQQKGFNRIIINLFNYLTVEENREQFQVRYEKIIPETTPVSFKAQVFNEIFEKVNDQDVSLTLKDSTGNELSFLFDKNLNEYSLNIGFLEAGNYAFVAKTELAGEEFIKEGSFNVSEVNVEQQNLHANFEMLQAISNGSSGRFFTENELDLLLNELKQDNRFKAKIYRDQSIIELINWRWYALVIILLLSLEWFLRKFWGLY